MHYLEVALKQFEATLVRLEDVLHFIGCSALVLVAVLINADIVGRLVFKVPIQFQFELVEYYLMPAVATLSLSKVFREGGHLALEVIPENAFGKYQPSLRGVTLLCGAIFFGLMSYMSGMFAAEAFLKDKVYFGIIDWPLGWAYVSVPVGCSVLTVRLLLEITKRSASSAQTNH